MAERALSHLIYGHSGAPTYSLEDRRWTFDREFAPTKFQQIGVRRDGKATTTEVVPSPIRFPSTVASTRLVHVNAGVKSLVQDYPELVSASDLLPEFATTSAAVLSAVESYDPLVGNLFAIGSVQNKWRSSRSVAATVTGEARNILRVHALHKETLGWSDDKAVGLRGDTLKKAESGYWNEEAAPIQQICFAQSQDESQLLAVRLPTKIVIFRPNYAQSVCPTTPSPSYELPASHIDLHPILAVTPDQNVGSADITFNPEYQLQYAVVSQDGTWAVWDIEYKRQRAVYTTSCLVRGTITEAMDLTGEDGWARIRWVGDVNTVLVCNRRLLSIFDLKGESGFERVSCPGVIPAKSSDWILDVSRHPSHSDRCFILTSTTLFLMAVTPSRDATTTRMAARILLSWTHYRNPEDLTLNMSVQCFGENGVCVLLQSRLETLVEVYTFRNHPSDSVSSANTTRLELAVQGDERIMQLAMEPLHFEGELESSSEGLARSYFAQGLKFYKIFVLRTDLSVHEVIICGFLPTNRDETMNEQSHEAALNPDRLRHTPERRVFRKSIADSNRQPQMLIEDITWSKIHQPSMNVLSAGLIEEMDDFIKPEGFGATDGPVSRLVSQVPQWTQTKSAQSHRVADNTSLYDALAGKNTNTIDVPVVTAQIKQLLVENIDVSQLPLDTL